jgi:hypothetical protein
MKTKSDKVYKGMVFAGCSFTWGQGLYYYSNMSTLKEPPPDAYNSNLVNHSHNAFRKTLYYPRLVANNFNTFEVSMIQNGGSEQTSLDFLRCVHGLAEPNTGFYTFSHLFEDIEYIVFQTSQPQRNTHYYVYQSPYDGNLFELSEFRTYSPDTHDKFYKYLAHQKKCNFDEWYNQHMKRWIKILKQNLQFYESKGIKTILLNWEPEYLPLIEKDEWLSKRSIGFDFDGKTYSCIRELMNENRFLHINGDAENFEDTPKDHHPSKQCHRIIADNIIKKIESNDITYGDMLDKNIDYLEYDSVVDNIYEDYVSYNPKTKKIEKKTENGSTNKLI